MRQRISLLGWWSWRCHIKDFCKRQYDWRERVAIGRRFVLGFDSRVTLSRRLKTFARWGMSRSLSYSLQLRKLTETSVRVAENFEAHFALSTWLRFRGSLDWSDDCQLLSAYTAYDFSQLSVGTSAFLFTELGGSPHQLSVDWNPPLVLRCVLQKSSWLCLLKAYRGIFFVVRRHVKGIPRCGTRGPTAFLSPKWHNAICIRNTRYDHAWTISRAQNPFPLAHSQS